MSKMLELQDGVRSNRSFEELMLDYWTARMVRAERENFANDAAKAEIRARIDEIRADLEKAA